MRRICTGSLTRAISKRAQNGAIPCPSRASSSERASEQTVTSWSAARCRMILNGRIFPPRLGGNGNRWQTNRIFIPEPLPRGHGVGVSWHRLGPRRRGERSQLVRDVGGCPPVEEDP